MRNAFTCPYPRAVTSPRATRLTLALALVAALAACSAEEPAVWQQPAGTPPVPAPADSAAPSSPPAAEITLAFAGDVHFTGPHPPLLEEPRPPRSARSPTQLRAADLAMVNLETAVTDRGTPEPKEFHFRAPDHGVRGDRGRRRRRGHASPTTTPSTTARSACSTPSTPPRPPRCPSSAPAATPPRRTRPTWITR